MVRVGIDDIAVYFPKLHFEIEAFSKFRGLEFNKLNKGLGLTSMAIPDAHEDTATMGANACVRLIDRNKLSPKTIGRIYLGTESALDGAKPTSTYIIDMLEQKYAAEYGKGCFSHCDVVDLNFACIGGVDAMHNTLDWVARGGLEENRLGIVVFSDNAKYDLNSSGEYTQGAGAGALLISHQPRLIQIPDTWGVSTLPVHDFFKPKREIQLKTLIQDFLDLAEEAGLQKTEGLTEKIIDLIPSSSKKDHLLFESNSVKIHKETPVFDGQFSNRCYTDAVKSAFVNFRAEAIRNSRYNPQKDAAITEQWSRIVVHLPYAFQGKRMLPDVFFLDRNNTPEWDEVLSEIGAYPLAEQFESAEHFEKAKENYRRVISKTDMYKAFVALKIEKTQRASSLVGNQYTGSIFLALMSTLEADLTEQSPLNGSHIGFCAYGSGAKAKVFEGIMQKGWEAVVKKFDLFPRLKQRYAIGAKTYEALHRGTQKTSVLKPSAEFVLKTVGGPNVLEGHRKYTWID